MRKCENCGKPIPLGEKHIEVRAFGYDIDFLDFCSPECFEEFFEKKRWKLAEEEVSSEIKNKAKEMIRKTSIDFNKFISDENNE